jgi:SnoaL-like domain
MGATTRPHTRNFFAMMDVMDVGTIASVFAEDGRLVFGNSQPLVGIDEIRTGTTAFFDTIVSLHHATACNWMRRPFIPDRGARTGPGRENRRGRLRPESPVQGRMPSAGPTALTGPHRSATAGHRR